MSDTFKACRCGASIPSVWVECQDCVVRGVQEAGHRRAKRLGRLLTVRHQMSKRHQMEAALSQHKLDNQATAILRARALGRAKRASRTAVALQEWMLGG